MIFKTCYTCKGQKTQNEFHKCSKEIDGLAYQCKDCKKAENMLRRYKISMIEYNQLFDKQQGSCAICNTHQSNLNKTLSVDHCHKTGIVRGLLCQQCNHSLGLFKDSTKNLLKAIEYLKLSNTDKSISL